MQTSHLAPLVQRERDEYRIALIRIEAFAGELEGRHTGFVHIGRMARLALRDFDHHEAHTRERDETA